MLNFDFLEKSLGIVSPANFAYDFSRKILSMLYSINWPNFIVWLDVFLEILNNKFIEIVCFPGCDVKIYLSNQAGFFWPKNQDKNIKAFFITFNQKA